MDGPLIEGIAYSSDIGEAAIFASASAAEVDVNPCEPAFRRHDEASQLLRQLLAARFPRDELIIHLPRLFAWAAQQAHPALDEIDGALARTAAARQRARVRDEITDCEGQRRTALRHGDTEAAAYFSVAARHFRREHRLCQRQTAASGSVVIPREIHSSRPRERRDSSRGRSRGSSAGDSSGEPGEPEPPEDGRRLCVGCGADISHMRADAVACSPKCRQRKRRGAYDAEGDPYLILPAFEHEALSRRALDACRCNGHHILDDEDGSCVKCGRPRNWALWHRNANVRLIQARSAEVDHDRPLAEVVR